MTRKTNKKLCLKFYLWIVLEPTDKPCKRRPLCSTHDDFAVSYIAGISPSNQSLCFVSRIVYCDETDEENPNVNVHQPTTFAHKNLKIEGITVFWVEFSDLSRAGCKSSSTPTVGLVSL